MKNFNLDKKTIFLINIFEIISFGISFIGIIFLYIFLKYYISSDLYDISIIIFRTGLLSGVFSFICGVIISNIKQGNL